MKYKTKRKESLTNAQKLISLNKGLIKLDEQNVRLQKENRTRTFTNKHIFKIDLFNHQEN